MCFRVVIALGSLMATSIRGQPGMEPKIEVASVKATQSASASSGNRFEALTMTWTNYTLKALVQNAYDVRSFEVAGAEGWPNSSGWDIVAKTNIPTTSDQKFKLLQPILADRFHLQCHFEMRQQPVYRLVIAPKGSRLAESRDEEDGGTRIGPAMISGRKAEISTLIYFLSGKLERPIIDETGLRGKYTFDLRWTPALAAPSDVAAPGITDPPNLLSAIDEQLGLRLLGSKGPVKVLVIDKVQRPTEN